LSFFESGFCPLAAAAVDLFPRSVYQLPFRSKLHRACLPAAIALPFRAVNHWRRHKLCVVFVSAAEATASVRIGDGFKNASQRYCETRVRFGQAFENQIGHGRLVTQL